MPSPPATLEEVFERAKMEQAQQQAIWDLEQPNATLDRRGSPPQFVRVTGRGQAIGEFGTFTYRQRVFHILDAIEYKVGQANSQEDLFQILESYLPSPIDFVRRRSRNPNPAPITWPDTPNIPSGFDPGGERRLGVYSMAVAKRVKIVPALATSRAIPQTESEENKRRGCKLVPLRTGLGNDPLATLYCQTVTGTSFS